MPPTDRPTSYLATWKEMRVLLQATRHTADYVEIAPSPSGKTQWMCRYCGRETQACERECYTFEMCNLEPTDATT